MDAKIKKKITVQILLFVLTINRDAMINKKPEPKQLKISTCGDSSGPDSFVCLFLVFCSLLFILYAHG
jgi:hypothetical protein